MSGRVVRVLVRASILTLIALPWSPQFAQSPATVRVSVSTAGLEGNGISFATALSGDGRYVTFTSFASNLVADDTNDSADVFVRDRLTGRTTRISVPAAGAGGGGLVEPNSGGPFISDDGRFVTFASHAKDLAPGDPGAGPFIFVRDRDVDADGLFDEVGQARTIRATDRPNFSPGLDLYLEAASGDGRDIAFRTLRQLEDSDTDFLMDVYVHDVQTHRTTRLAPGANAPVMLGGAMSSSGRIVVALGGTAPMPGFDPVSVIDRDTNGNGLFDEAGDTTITPVPMPPGGVAAGATPAAVSRDGVLVVVNRLLDGDGRSELWLWHRIGNVGRRIATLGPGQSRFEGVRVSDDNRRAGYTVTTTSSGGGPLTLTSTHHIVTFDADGDSHLDDPATISTTNLPALGSDSAASFDGTLRYFSFVSGSSALAPGDANGVPDAFVHDLQSPAFDSYDTDGDGLANAFESRFGLSASTSTGADGASGDPDGDGRTNAQEQEAGTHPRGFFTRYLAEGATGSFFSTRISVANPSTEPASVLLRYQTDTGQTTSSALPVAGMARRFVNVGDVASLASAAFSTVIESDRAVIVDRSMFWADGFYGSHAESSVAAPATTWYLAEGATHGFFDLFYLVQNPSATDAASIEVRYLLPSGPPVVRTYAVAPSTRLNILVDNVPGLEAVDVSAVITSTNNVPVIVERSMYFSRPGQPFGAGHASAGVTGPSTTWFLAEGATGTYFDLYVLVANPSASPADVRMTYLRPAGAPVVRTRTIPGNSRLTIYVEDEDPALADTPVSTIVEATNSVPIVVERAMWWPTPGSAWQEAHNSFGATQPGVRWGFADGESGPPPFNTQTYFLVANVGTTDATVRVTLLFDSGPPVSRDFAVPANSRFNVPAGGEFPESAGRGFGAIVESLGATPAPIVVERAMYSDAQGVVWAAGTNVLGTRLP
jgi:hypothetical protein